MTVEQIAEQVALYPAKHVVVTGGEPMIAPQIVALTERLRQQDLHITIETAGTMTSPVVCDLMSISPKLKNSVPLQREGGRWAAQHERTRWQPDVLKALMAAYEYQLKFVIADPQDLDEVEEMRRALDAPRAKVLLMPEGTSAERIRQRGLWLAESCKQHGFRFSPRLHVDLWGDKRGV